MPEHILLIVALQDEQPDRQRTEFLRRQALYGRSWGTLEYHDGLHFETCYYQAIEFCIANRIATFEGGAQGEHKLARGFLPVTTWSAHWLAHPRFASAVEEFLQRESGGIERYVDELNEAQQPIQCRTSGAIRSPNHPVTKELRCVDQIRYLSSCQGILSLHKSGLGKTVDPAKPVPVIDMKCQRRGEG
jgi:hypothetical protein